MAMNKDEITSSLILLAKSDAHRSEMAQLKEVHNEIEAALASGVKMHAVWELLQQKGLKMHFQSFKNALTRIRKARNAPTHGTSKNIIKNDTTEHQTPSQSKEPNRATDKSSQTTHESTVNRYLKKIQAQKAQREEFNESISAREESREADASKEQRLTDKQRWEALADRFIRPENTNPVLKRLLEKEKEKTSHLPSSVKDTPDSA